MKTKKNYWTSFLMYTSMLFFIFNALIQYCFARKIHWYVYIFFTVYIIISLFVKILTNKEIILVKYILYLIIFLFLSFAFSLIKNPFLFQNIVAFFPYFNLIIFFGIFFSINLKKFNIDRYIKILIFLGFITSLLGIYQNLVDITIFGIADKLHYFNDEKLADFLVNSYEYKRATALFSAIQEYGMFISLTTLLYFENVEKINIKSFLKFPIGVIFFIGGICSGGRIYILNIFIFILYMLCKKIFQNKCRFKKNFLKTISYSVLVVLFSPFIYSVFYKRIVRMVLFFFDKHEFLYQESGRIEIMKKIFDDGFFVFLTGHGLGTSFNTLENFFPQNNINRTTVENGYATICYEIGIFIAILYLFMLLKSLSCSIRNNNRYNTFSCTSVILAIIISCFFVHTFVVSTVFLSFELIVFYQIYLNEMHKHQIIRYLRLERSNFE